MPVIGGLIAKGEDTDGLLNDGFRAGTLGLVAADPGAATAPAPAAPVADADAPAALVPGALNSAQRGHFLFVSVIVQVNGSLWLKHAKLTHMSHSTTMAASSLHSVVRK